MRRIALSAAVTLAALAHADAETERKSPRLWEPKTRSATVFKDGYGFFVREGEVQPAGGWAVAGALPPAAFGTLAFYSLDEKELVDIVGSGPGQTVDFDGHDAPRELAAKRTLLEQYLDLDLALTYRKSDEDRAAAGKLVSVAGDFALVESKEGINAVPLESVTKLQLLQLPLRLHVSREGKDSSSRTNLGVAYLREGITWVPEYTLRLTDEKTAELTLRGVVINHAEDLVKAEVNFVVGTPNFAHRAQASPLLAGQVLRMIGGAVGGYAMSQIANGMVANMGRDGSLDLVTQPADDNSGSAIRGDMGNLPRIESEGASDFSVYRIADLTVREGERASVSLFSRKISYGHLYKWDGVNAICHHLLLKNDSAEPWTTGPLIALSDKQPLAEDLFKYVPAGGTGEFPLTEAINITKKVTEVESDRALKAYQVHSSSSFDLVTLSGEIMLRNFDKNDVHLLVDYPVPGKATQASHEGKTELKTDSLQLTQRKGTIKWDLTLKPGETTTLKYTYERYVPSA